MTTTSPTTMDGAGTHRMKRREVLTHTGVRVGRMGLDSVAILTILIAAWGGIVPFIGPVFGYGATGTGSWHWSLSHSVLALSPGAIGVVVGFLVLASTKGVTAGRGRISLLAAGLLLFLCGAWFVVGPAAWPVLTTQSGYFVGATPFHELMNELGYSLGVGVILGVCGGFTMGWAARHRTDETVRPAGGSPA